MYEREGICDRECELARELDDGVEMVGLQDCAGVVGAVWREGSKGGGSSGGEEGSTLAGREGS